MNNNHPTYPNPVIEEAICEIRFGLEPDKDWDATFISKFFKKIEADFPEFEPVTDMGIEFRVGPNGVHHSLPIPRQRTRYKHKENKYILQLYENVFVVNILKTYPGWQIASKVILEHWSLLQEVVNADKISRIGLRYINKIPRTSPDQKASYWLRPNEYFAPKILDSLPGFLSRTEIRLSDTERAIISLGESEENDFIYDIDCLQEADISTNAKDLECAINKLHNTEWEIFQTARTTELEELMNNA